MSDVISKGKIEELKGIKGQARGAAFKSPFKFVLKREGRKGVELVEKTMKELGCPLKHKELSTMRFYPIHLCLILQAVIQGLFGYGDEEFEEMGRFNSKNSMVMRLFTKYFASLENVVGKTPRAWRMYFSAGTLEVVELNREGRYVRARLKESPFPPLYCPIVKGFFSSVLQMIVNETVSSE